MISNSRDSRCSVPGDFSARTHISIWHLLAAELSGKLALRSFGRRGRHFEHWVHNSRKDKVCYRSDASQKV